MALNLVGFDSAWGDRTPGAICAARVGDGQPRFDAPRPVRFAEAEAFIRDLHRDGDLTLVAIDQPTIVPNENGARPAERAVASLMSFAGGAIQPAFRGGSRAAVFGDGAPIWRFLDALGATDDPEAAALAEAGLFAMEVFPALAVLAFDPAFTAAPRRGPRYNPSRPTFSLAAWEAVCSAVGREARRHGLDAAADWCDARERGAKPRKTTQDGLDAVICLLVAARWRYGRDSCVMLGDLRRGYIAAPASPVTRAHLGRAAAAAGVPIA